MKTFAHMIVRGRWVIVVAALGFVAMAAVLGSGVADRLVSGGYVDDTSPSAQAARELADRYSVRSPNLVILVRTQAGVDDPAVAQAGLKLTEELSAEPGLTSLVSYWTSAPAPEVQSTLRSTDGRAALIVATVTGSDPEAKKRVVDLQERYAGVDGPLTVSFSGWLAVDQQIDEQSKSDLLKAELLVLPITLIILLLAFRTAVAGTLPLVIAGVAVVGSQLILDLLRRVTDVSIFALNVTTALGLGLAIDYSLLMVSRFREALRDHGEVEPALAITLSTAGKTIIYSSITVAFSLAGGLMFNMFFLRSLAYAGVAVALLAGAAALLVLPAVLAILGPRVNRGRIPFLGRGSAGSLGEPSRAWAKWAERVTARPWLFTIVTVAILVTLALPVLGIRFSLGDDRMLPPSSSTSQVQNYIREHFSTDNANDLHVVASGTAGGDATQLAGYAQRLSQLDGITRVDCLAGSYVDGVQVAQPTPYSARFAPTSGTGSYLTLVVSYDPLSQESRDLITQIREVAAPFPAEVAGPGADYADTLASQARSLPKALAVMALASMVLLALMTGSLIVPIKAILMNVFTLSAAMGVVVWVFQEGHLKWLVGDFQVTGYIPTMMPLLLLFVAFGLSMDYEMFLLSRIKEEYDRTGSNHEALVVGISRTSRLITAAAVLLSAVFFSFVVSGTVYLKLLGLGTGLAILIDATLIRGVLLPAVMALMGNANWWGPRFLKRWSASFAESEVTPAGDGATADSVNTTDGVNAADSLDTAESAEVGVS